ncbi:MAG: CGNR zinc finger domain-containing protein, partial [Stackebrandtia sp.]
MTFTFVSANLALDFVGTVQRRRAKAIDLLESPAALADWTVASGVVDSAAAVDDSGLADAKRLREAIYRTALAAIRREPYPCEDVVVLNRFAKPAPAALRLKPEGSLTSEGDLPAVLSTVANDAIELLGGPNARRIRECDAETCTRLYLESARGRARRWCDMSRCGNRAKASAFR